MAKVHKPEHLWGEATDDDFPALRFDLDDGKTTHGVGSGHAGKAMVGLDNCVTSPDGASTLVAITPANQMTTTAIASTDVTGATTTTLLLYDSPPPPSPPVTATTNDLGAALSAAIASAYVAHLSGTFTVTTPIVVHVNNTIQGPLGIDLGGATIVSEITSGAPVIEIDVGPGVDFRYLTLSNFTIQGNGREGDGIKIVADGNDRWAYNWNISNVTVNHVGGYGLDMQGSVFEGLVSNSWMTNDALGGAYFSHSAGGGIASALRWFGGGFENNGGAGLTLDNGARDMSLDGATFTDNHGVGISASQGITSVTGSIFDDNHGAGVWFQNYGNFNDDTFSTSGSQTVGIIGYLAGGATLIGDTSTYTGTGPDPTMLANVQGNGSVLALDNGGEIVAGSNVTLTTTGEMPNISMSGYGVALPTLAAITADTTAPVPTSTGTGTLETALKSAMADGYVAHLTDSSYTATSPIVINVRSSIQGACGIDLGGATIVSQIVDGSPVIEIIVGASVELDSLLLTNFSIQGNGHEGDGVKIVVDGSDRAINNLTVANVNVEHVGGIGFDVIGNIRQGLIFDSWMHGDAQGGARFANSPAGGVASGLEWEGGGFRKNGVAGMILDNGTHDMVVKGAYFVENYGPGIDATSGITLVQETGFENNQGTGAIVQGPGNFTDDTFSTYGPQTVGIGGYLEGGKITLTGDGNEYYGPGSDPTALANIQGNGTLATQGGHVVVGSNIAVVGASPVVGVSATMPAIPIVTEYLADDTGVSPTDHVTSNAAITGLGDPNAVVHFAIDGATIADTVTANSSGAWSYTPTGLADGQHTIVASETNAAGTGNASLTFTLDTSRPTVIESLVNDTGASSTDHVTSNRSITGLGDPNAVVYFAIDGATIADTATANSSGVWSFTPTGLADGTHTITANETDLAGNTGSALLTFTLDSKLPAVTETLVSGTPASTPSPAVTGSGDPNAVVHFTVDGSLISATATADPGGTWSFTPTELVDGMHTIVASETDLAGNTGSASLSFMLQTGTPTPPVFTSMTPGGGSVTLTGSTGEAGDFVEIYDGNTWIGGTHTDGNGNWSFTAAAVSTKVHYFGLNDFNLAGDVIHGANEAILGGTKTATLTGTTGNDIINAYVGRDTIVGGAGGDTLTGGSKKVTFSYGLAGDATPAASDTITDFQHAYDKIDFTNIPGINATNGIPQFQGNITGSGNLTLKAHSVAFMEVGGNTLVLANTTNAAEIVTTSDTHAANMEIDLVGIHLGLRATDFHHV